MTTSHPAPRRDQGKARYPQRVRNTVASFVLLACLVSLTIFVHSQFGSRFAMLENGAAAIELTQHTYMAELAPAAVDPNSSKYLAVGEYLARRYKVSAEVTTNIVTKVYTIAQELKLDPLLILAVISVESRFNPIAESTMGAKGLMQVIPRYHPEKFVPLGGEKVVFEPEANIMVGARILKEYLRRTGDMGDALQMYVGATSDETENAYSNKVMIERDRLNRVLRQHQGQARPDTQPPSLMRPPAAI